MERTLDWSWILWMLLGLLAMAVWWISFRRQQRRAAVWLLAACACVGAGWHHLRWSVMAPNDISRFARAESRLARFKGVVAERPWTIPRGTSQSAWSEPDRTLCTVRCTSIETDAGTHAAAGKVRLSVSGHLLNVDVGDEVEVIGTLNRPDGPQNPGEFDFRSYLQTRGVRAVAWANHPDCVRVLRRGADPLARLWRLRGHVRTDCERLLNMHLSEKSAPIAEALLLGSRGGLGPEVRKMFSESGTMHLLAISGQHVMILLGFLLFCCRASRSSSGATLWIVLCAILLYAFITEARPPVLRATVFCVIGLMGLGCGFARSGSQLLAVAALVVLAVNPTDLFDTGAQLSFLAVTAIAWSARGTEGGDPLASLTLTGKVWRWLRPLRNGYRMTAAIWLLTAPLVAARFHLVSAIGFGINVLLVPLVIATLWLGYVFMIAGLLIPASAAPLGFLFDGALRLLLSSVEWSSSMGMGHLYVPGPPDWWLAGFYACAVVIVIAAAASRLRYWAVRGALCWTVVGLVVPLASTAPRPLRCTFLAVGHGCAIVLECPNGSRLVYDAGSLDNARRAGQAVQSLLWESGTSRIDALVISHADFDHFGGVPDLLETVSVGRVMIAPSFLDLEQSGVLGVLDAARRQSVPIHLIWQGDRLLLDPSVRIRVLHPAANDASSHDNSNSIVLLIEYAGRRILLTGDLERDGLESLLAQDFEGADVLLSPHHGSRAANSPELARWAGPSWVVASTGRRVPSFLLSEQYAPGTRVLTTAEEGAVIFEIAPDGALRRVSPSRSGDAMRY